jgi:hypothetical protein
VTIAQTLFKLTRMGSLLAPKQDWGWLREIACDRDLDANPKPRFDRIVTSERLVEAGLGLIRSARRKPRLRKHWRATMIRNGLMVALLGQVPIRLKNFASLTLGQSFKRIGDRWWIVLGRRETKSGAPDERPVPGYLNQAIAIYPTYARPILLGEREFMIGEPDEKGSRFSALAGALWIGERGEPLGYSQVERAIMDTTRQTIGRALSPHDFRRNGATTARLRAGNEPHLASGLLHHRDQNVHGELQPRLIVRGGSTLLRARRANGGGERLTVPHHFVCWSASRPSSPFPLLDAAPQTGPSFRKRAPAARYPSRSRQTPQATNICDP